MKRVLLVTPILVFFPAMVAINSWFFRTHLGISYLDWYIANGALISAAASLFAVIWKNLDKNDDLIAADPRVFLAANLILIGSQFEVIGHHLENAGARFRAHRPLGSEERPPVHESSVRAPVGPVPPAAVPIPDLLEGVGALLATVLMVSALAVWFVAIVPLQYFIVLVAGAPARLALKLKTRTTNPIGRTQNVPPAANGLGEWESNLGSAPVSMTNAVAALLILAVKLAHQ